MYRSGIIRKSPEEIEKMAAAGRIQARCLRMLRSKCRPGVTTAELDDIVRDHMLREGAVPATLGYRGYTKSCCTSINHVVCHGIPGDRALKDGDIVNIDVTPILDGWHGDTSRMYLVGDVPLKARKLVDVTYECLMLGLEQARPGNHLGDISHAIQRRVEDDGLSIIRSLVGHGIGRDMHEDPQVPNYGEPGKGPELEPGMVLAIEPMVNAGGPDVRVGEDNWAVYSADGSLAAHFEFTVAVTEDGPRILTPWHE